MIFKPSAWHGKSLLNLLHAIFQEPGLQCFHGFMHCEMQELKVVHVSVCKIHKHPLIPGFHNPNMVSIKAKYGGYIIKFMLSLSSRLVQLHKEVARRLNLEAGTYHVVSSFVSMKVTDQLVSQKNVFTDVPAFNESRLMGTQ
ncbi:hypothetical protein Vadar_025622 [Vaccinium darrowii]|uniref:Uncharacterized protein n=1 Tax=Vaccinium darrowii TaxID=229202 RepID=A0ACB7XJV7_9ERIC|nr:hypothetical protein Vadar_025622 [Vaccinium darrowii]